MWRLLQLLSVCAAFVARAQVVINEIHYDPADRTRQEEFIELHNVGPTPVELGGWRLEDGVEFTFPAGTSIPAGGFRVVAQNTAHFQAKYAQVPLGPWTGSLRNSGERIQLRNATGQVIDEVTFGAGFPWPTSARGEGPSLELLNPSLDNDLGGSWRSGATRVLIPRGASDWRFRPGTSEASAPTSAWRTTAFVEDATWQTAGRLPLGYGEPDILTPLTGMQGVYWSVFLRKTFVLPPGGVPSGAVLRLRVDDGCVAWINGVPVTPSLRTSGTPVFNGGASESGFVTENAPEPASFQEFSLEGSSGLRVGTNVLALQVFNTSLGSSDLLIDAELIAGASAGTPGATNSVFTTVVPPQIRQVQHTPEQPTPGVPVVVSARITDPDGVAGVTLRYQLVQPGSYLRKSDPAYETSWSEVPMNDAGTGGDAVAGDGTFSATLPALLQEHRRLIRYRITATDGTAAVSVPYPDDEQPNFAYFVYGGLPAWTARNRPPSGTPTTFPPSLLSSLPAYHLLVNESDVLNSQYNGSFDTVRMWGTLVYDGQVYDHIRYHNKGSASTYQSGKNKWRFRFNRARGFAARDSWGRPYSQTWDTFTMHACASPWNPVFRGWAGLDEVVSARIFEFAGAPSPKMHHLGLRVIRRAAESATAGVTVSDPFSPSGSFDGQYSSDLWGLYLAVEDPDGSFLDERELPDGSVYHIVGNEGDKTHQGATHPRDVSDWNSFRDGSQSRTANTPANEAWWRANLDLPSYYGFHAANRITGNVDLREGWNHYFYHRGSDGRWLPIPWDLDMMYFPETHWSGTIDQRNCLTIPSIRLELRNRCRELLDLICEDASITGGQIGQLVEEYRRIIQPAGESAGWDVLDQYLWNYHPRTTGGHTGRFYLPRVAGDDRIGGSWTRTYATADFAGVCRFLVDYATDTDPTGFSVGDGDQRGYGYNYLELEAADPAVPQRPTLGFSGRNGFPVNDLTFTASDFADPQGAESFAGVQWRLGEIAAPGVSGYRDGDPFTYEATELYRTAVISNRVTNLRFPVSVCQPGHTYRARVRYLDNTGRWSRWSPAVQFVAGVPDVALYRTALVVSELNYNPAPATPAEFAAGFSSDDFEWIELNNVGTAPLDLTGLQFNEGIDFVFPDGWTIPAGGYALAVRNRAAFRSRYGMNWESLIAGETADNFRNSGERVTLSYGAATPILSFAYGDSAPWPAEADGEGRTLTLRQPTLRPDPNLPASWKASAALGGSPGSGEGTSFYAWKVAYPGVVNPVDDADGDGLPNLLEYLLNSHPLLPATTRLLSGELRTLTVKGVPGEYLTVSFTRRLDLVGASWRAEFAGEVSGVWQPGVLAQSIPMSEGVTELWRSPEPVTERSTQFGRLSLELVQ
ncbi:MAG: lamin tail domain-containing protein [Verrucomicrobia bacterium]|nr:lamin tail domain-containing protein [Verrucomicrobiota bacterium]